MVDQFEVSLGRVWVAKLSTSFEALMTSSFRDVNWIKDANFPHHAKLTFPFSLIIIVCCELR